MAEKVRYRVLKPVFVNGSIHAPVPGREVFVDAAPGLAGSALELVEAKPAGGAERRSSGGAGGEPKK